MPTIEQNAGANRYPGVKPFRPEEKELFFGREEDIKSLFSLIFVKQVVVLYGKSGYGKSSLINAGIIPLLEGEENLTYFNIRFNYFSKNEDTKSLAPVENVKRRVRKDLDSDRPSPLDSLIAGEDSFWYWIKTYQHQKNKNRFIFFFDQFEELFSYPKAQIDEFAEQLSQFLYSHLPTKFRKRLAEMDERGEVADELYNFLQNKPEIKVVFSVRSDRLSQLNGLAERMPTILQNCYELETLDREQAEKAITAPAALRDDGRYLTTMFRYTADAVTKILDSVCDRQDEKIETGTLQIICRHVEDALVNGQRHSVINSQLLGDITDIFQQYYEGILNKLPPADRLKTRRLIEEHLLMGGRRNPLGDEYIRTNFDFNDLLLQQLEASSLLRKERDAAGRMLVELSHDSLVRPITIAKEKRLVQEEQDRKGRELEARRQLELDMDQLRKARELDVVNQTEQHLRESETLRRQYNFFVVQGQVKAYLGRLSATWRGFVIIGALLALIIWTTVATVTVVRQHGRIKANAEEIRRMTKEVERVEVSMDSLRRLRRS